MITANIFRKIFAANQNIFSSITIVHLHAYFSPACQGPGTGGCMWTLVTLLLLPLLCLLVTLPLLSLLSLSTVLLVSPCHPSLSSATPWLLNFRLKQLLSPSSSPSSPQFFNLPGILSYSLISAFSQKISPLTFFLPIFVPPGPLPPQRWWDLGGTRCLA